VLNEELTMETKSDWQHISRCLRMVLFSRKAYIALSILDMVAACQQLADLSPKVFQSATNQGILAVRWLTRQASLAGLLQEMSVSVPT